MRIASLLHAREESSSGEVHLEFHGLTSSNGVTSVPSTPSDSRSRKRKHKVYIHSSPFQRCIQTSVGIGAGLAQYQGMAAGRARSDSRTRTTKDSTSSPRLHAVDTSAASLVARSHLRKSLKDQPTQAKPTLRIDAYLGEWLSPDYFDLITPPPNSIMMVAGAKADLLRRGEDLDSYALSPGLANKASQGSLWSSNRGPDSSATSTPDGPLDMKALAQALPGRDRALSYSSGRVSPFGRPVMSRAISGEAQLPIGYTPPTPGYAISPVEPIPKGYVAHARDACVDVDYSWDSMREPLMWGDGGEYGEEWSAMHKRFRKGLCNLINWYGDHPHGNVPDEHEAVPAADDNEAEEVVVVVLVTHGAGCNALIGALTEQPVLIDVGMASMTMAVRREHAAANGHSKGPILPSIHDDTQDTGHTGQRGSMSSLSINTGLSDVYEVTMTASSEHLRPGSDPSRPATPVASSPSLAATKTVPDARRRSTLMSHSAAGSPLEPNWSITEHPRGNTSTALGSIRRLSTQNIQPTRSGSVSSVASMTGLWTPSTPPLNESGKDDDTPVGDKKDSPGRDMLLDSRGSPQPPADNKLGISYVPDGNGNTLDVDRTPRRSLTEDASTVPRISTTMASPRREREEADSVPDLPRVPAQVPMNLNRTLSQKGLWGSAPSGAQVRDRGPKRRWTLQQE